ncbi:MAG: cell wall-binding repeat-containing protein [Actinomycetota bacterium]|nr:cell wall-binding repeat-containing protein [Actinomycetota bacterium]
MVARKYSLDPGSARARVRALLVTLLIATAVTLFGSLAEASAYSLDLSTEDLSRLSQRVVVGEVVGLESREDAALGIVTEVSLAVERRLKGDCPERLTFLVAGGSVNGIAIWASDTPAFTLGERVAVFLDAKGLVVGGGQGRLGITESDRVAETGESLSRLVGRVARPTVDSSLIHAFPEVFGLAQETAEVSVQSVAPQAGPTITSISPGSAAAGVGDVVTIIGSGFGSTKGSVNFFYQDNMTIQGEATSWTDTTIRVVVPVGEVVPPGEEDSYPASASSGPVTVRTSGGLVSNSYSFNVTFSYSGVSWADPNLDYYVNPNTSDTAAELGLVQSAAAVWTAQTPFNLTYRGTRASGDIGNDLNELQWRTDMPPGQLGRAFIRYYESNYEIIEADVGFNDTYYAWGDGSGETVDIWTVALHETGHWLSLRDLYGAGDSGEVMYGRAGIGQQKRALAADDVAGAQWIYGSSGDAPVTTASGIPPGWSRDPVTVTLTATDPTGVDRTTYRINESTPFSYSSPFTITAQGPTTISFWSVDDQGNVESVKTVTTLIDGTAPVTATSGRALYFGSATIALSASDPLSGVAKTYYRIDDGPTMTGTSATVSSTGDHTVAYWSSDLAGNTENSHLSEFTVLDPPDVDIERVSGTSRYDTAAEIIRNNFAEGSSPVVVLATGAGFADALSASGLAGSYNAPLLLTPRDTLDWNAASEMERLGADTVIIVGGEAAISSAVGRELADRGYAVDRIAGTNRYDTAARVARRIAQVGGASFSGAAFVARGDNFADALAAAPYAYAQKMPILLVAPTALPGETASAARDIGVDSIIVAGGTLAVSDAVAQSFDVPWTRVSSSTRYSTAAAVIEYALSQGWCSGADIGLATGQNFPDALGGGVAMGSRGGIVVLTPSESLGPDAALILLGCGVDVSTLQVFGGTTAVNSAVVDSVCDLWGLQ